MSVLALCMVLAVSDGDTLKMSCQERVKPVTVRLVEIDAPEVKHSGFAKMDAQPFSAESKANLTRLCYKQPATVTATSVDRYGRTLGRVTCNGVNVNEAQITAGYAMAYLPKRGSVIPALEAEAKVAHRGLWSDQAPVPPWIWRKKGSCS